MKIHFWTSSEYGGFMNSLMEELSKKGITARQKFNISEKTYRNAKNFRQRVLLRLRQYLFYPLQLVLSLVFQIIIGRRNNLIVVSTNTFYAPFLATLFNCNVIHLVYDLFPEALIHSGKWKESQNRAKIAKWIVGLTLKRARTNIFLGSRLKKFVERVHINNFDSFVIPVGADAYGFKSFKDLDNQLINILYCGNFGHMHEIETLKAYWLEMKNRNFKFIFHCSGPKRKNLELFVANHKDTIHNLIQVDDGLNYDDWIDKMSNCEIALVTMKEGAEEVVMPSKTYSAMMAGQAILAIAPEESDLVDLIKDTNCGWWVAPNNIDGLNSILESIDSNRELILEKRKNAFNIAHANYTQNILADKWITVIDSLRL